MADALRGFAAVLDIDRDVHGGDRFYVHYEEGFSRDGRTTTTGRVLWAELALKGRKEPVAILRFRPLSDGQDSFWLTNGEGAWPPQLRVPVDIVVVSSGFGLRAVPIDQPWRFAGGQSLVKVPARAPTLPTGFGHGANGGVLLRPVSVRAAPGRAPGLSLAMEKYSTLPARPSCMKAWISWHPLAHLSTPLATA
jgi:hypothetical protein